MKVALIIFSMLLTSHLSQASDPAKIRKTIRTGDTEKTMISKWEGVALRGGVLPWGGTGNHRLILALPDGKQITFEVVGPYLSEWAEITTIGEIEPIQDWASIPGIQLVDLSLRQKPNQNPAEQGGTGQPATRPESKSEDGDKPKPESEGRAR